MKNRIFHSLVISLALMFPFTQTSAFPIDVLQGGTLLGTIDPFVGTDTGAVNYGYSSFSAHPIVGPAPAIGDVQFWFYNGSDGLNFVMVFGVDNSGTSFGNDVVDADITITGSSSDPTVRLSDESGELVEVGSTDVFQGRWVFGDNTDGGVIGEIGGMNWEVTFDPILYMGMTTANAYGSTGTQALALNTTDDIVFRPYVTPVNSIPEPFTLALMGFGLLGVGFAGRRRKT